MTHKTEKTDRRFAGNHKKLDGGDHHCVVGNIFTLEMNKLV